MSDQPEKKIIVDEDWKSQVQAEKESGEQAPPPEATEAPAGGPVGPLPPPDLAYLLTTLTTQAMMMMGMVPNPVSGQTEVELDYAKHFIDTIQMLQEKTEGNRTPEESQMVDGMLHELRMGFVAVQQQGGGA